LLSKQRKVEYIQGRAAFENSNTLRISKSAGGEESLSFDRIILATGSRPAVIPAFNIGSARVWDSTAALNLGETPGSLLVIGGGYIGLELGQVYAALGSQVTLVEMTDGLLPGVDRDLVQPLARRCEKTFAAIHLGTRVSDLREVGDAVQARVGESTATFDRVLVAVGRRPQTSGLGLQTTQARLTERGFIEVDERGRTADPHVWAVGDATGEPMLAHRAMRQGKVTAEAVAGRPVAFDNVVIPAVVFTDPEVAWCGLTETAAAAAGRAGKVARFSWAASGRAATIGRSDGATKLLVDPDTGRVVGVGIVGPGAGELIAEGALAVENALLAEDLALTIHTHPTLSETLMEAAETLLH